MSPTSEKARTPGLDRALLAVAVLFVGLALLHGIYILTTGDLGKNPKRMFYTALPGLLAFLLWLRGNAIWKRRLLVALFLIVMVEGTLQVAAVFGLVPRVHIYKHVPYGRVYYTKEGFANERMNRFGWHAREFATDPDLPRIALLGDSFVLAAGVPRETVAGSLLEDRLRATGHPHHVVPLGISNTGPAHYLELMDYAIRHFPPQEIVIAFFLGNDFRNLQVPDSARRRARSIYYTFGPDGRPTLLPESQEARRVFVNQLEYNHRSPLLLGPMILRSYFLTPSVVKETREVSRSLWDRVVGSPESPRARDFAAEMRWLGLDAFVFHEPLSAEAEQVIAMGLALLDESRRRAAEHGIDLRLVTIPALFPSFYERYQGEAWSFQVDEHDLALPDRRIEAFAAERGIPFLSLGRRMLAQGLTVEDLHALYFMGYGHLSNAGQAYLADAIYEEFYESPAVAQAER